MKNRALAGITILGFSMIVGHFGAKPLLAQIRAALVKNVDEPGRIPYQASASCPSTIHGDCVALLTPVPDGKRLVVQHASVLRQCITIPCAGSFFGVRSHNHSLLTGPAAYISSPTLTNTDVSVDQDIRLYLEAGDIPTVEMGFGEGESFASFTITGYLIDLNQ